ncbi:hypothetical protein F9L04_20575 [Brucella anthropi]|uniref:Nucleoside 2-deoxyribosyltransferase n=1 Tax=Brucella anthropi TaxID=529 RepID=A0A6L3Z0R4_BRUAN|nr:hypothetical protein F9L04_20575 [Brucella anthropi]
MFNLLMFNADWPSGRVTVPVGRMFEYTEAHIIEQFRANNAPLLDKLTALPCLFCEEGTGDEVAYVGQINRARIVGGDVSLEIGFDADVPPLRNSQIYDSRAELDMPREFEFSRNHWAVKEVDLYRFLLRRVRPRRQRPTVFPLAEHENLDPHLASAMMPFDAAFNPVFDAIRNAAQGVGLRCRRADDIWENASIIQDVVSLIDRSRVVICDCSGRNPNVFYEAGIAHTLGREVILIAQSDHDIPFDLRHLRYVRYLNNDQGRAELSAALLARIQTIIGH